jgi:hypothetical protein
VNRSSLPPRFRCLNPTRSATRSSRSQPSVPGPDPIRSVDCGGAPADAQHCARAPAQAYPLCRRRLTASTAQVGPEATFIPMFDKALTSSSSPQAPRFQVGTQSALLGGASFGSVPAMGPKLDLAAGGVTAATLRSVTFSGATKERAVSGSPPFGMMVHPHACCLPWG